MTLQCDHDAEKNVCAMCGRETNTGRWVKVPECFGKWFTDEWHCFRCRDGSRFYE